MVDELRGYDTVLTTEDITRLNGLFDGTLTSAGTTYTQPTFNQTFQNIFRATDSTSPTDYGTLANWYTPRVLKNTSTEETTTYWDSYTGTLAPGVSGTGATYGTNMLVDGDLFSNSSLTKDETTGRYNISLSSAQIEGWALKLGVANNVHLTFNDVRKLQSDSNNNNNSWIYVDETSKLTITTLGSQGSNSLGGAFHIMSEEGMTVTNAFAAGGGGTYYYYLYDKGSVSYAGLSGATRTHTVAEVTLALGDNTKKGRDIITRKLIGFTSTASQTYNYTNTGVTTVDNASSTTVSATEKTSEVELFDAVGTYYFYTVTSGDAPGYYVQYVAYGDNITYTRTVTGTTAEDWSTTENSWGIYRGAAETTAPDADGKALVTTTDSVTSTLTMNAAQTLETFAVEGTGSLTIKAGTYTTTTTTESTDGSGTTTETTADGSLTVTETTLYAPLTVESGASLGTVNVSDGGSLAVTSLDQFTTLNGDELTTVGAITLSSASDATKIPSTLNVEANTVTLGYSGFAASKTINVGGGTDTASLKLNVTDATGYTTAGTGIHLLTNGTLEVAHRDTFITPLYMQGGTLKLLSGAADSGRAFDFYASGGNTVNVLAATDASETNLTVSTWTVDSTSTNANDAKMAIRQGALNINVETNAELDVDASIINYGSSGGALNKTGEGKLVFKRANSYTTATNVDAGTLQLVDAGTMGTGVVTVDAGATLDFASTETVAHSNTISNAGTISFTGTGTTTLSGTIANASGTIAQSGTGMTTLSGSVSEGTLTVSAGTLTLSSTTDANATVSGGTFNATIMGTVEVTGDATLSGMMPTVVNESSTITVSGTLTMTAGDEGKVVVPEGATLNLVLPAKSYIYGYTNTSISNSGTVNLYIPGTTDFSSSTTPFLTYEAKEVAYTSTMKVWTSAEDGTGTWSDLSRWTDSAGTTLTAMPTESDAVAIYIAGDTDTTVTVTADSTVASVAVYSEQGANLTFLNTTSTSTETTTESTESTASSDTTESTDSTTTESTDSSTSTETTTTGPKLTVTGAFSVGSSMTITDAPPVLACTSLNVDRNVDLIFTPGDTSNIPADVVMECPTTTFTGLGTLRLQGIPNGTATYLDIAPTLTFYLVDTKLGLTATGTSATIGIDGTSTLYETVSGAFTNVEFAGVTTTDAETGEETTTYGTVEIALTTAGDEATTTTLPASHFDDFAGTLLISGGRYNAGSTPIASTTAIKITNGGQLYLTGGTWANAITAAGNGWTPSDTNTDAASGSPLRIDGTTLTGAVTIEGGAPIMVWTNYTGTIGSAATLTAASGFTKLGAGTLTLAGQTYANVAGTVIVDAGTLDWDADSKVSAGTTVALGKTISVSSGAKLNLHVSTATVTSDTPSALVTLGTAITLNDATLTTEDGSYYYSKAFTVTGDSTYTMTYRKTVIFADLNAATGTTLTASVASKTDGSTPARFTVLGGDFNGTLDWKGDTATGGSSDPIVDTWLGVGSETVFADATITFSGVQSFLRLLSNATVGSLTITEADTTGGVFTDGTGAKTLTLNGGQINYALKDVSSGANTSSPLSLIVAGDVTLNGTNTLSGTVAVNSGTLTVNPSTTDAAVFTKKTVTLASGATLDLRSGSGTSIYLTNNGGTVNYQAGSVTILATRDTTSTDTTTSTSKMIVDTGTYTVGAGLTLEVDMDLAATMGDGYTFNNITFTLGTDETALNKVVFQDVNDCTFTDASKTYTEPKYVFTLGVATWTASGSSGGSWSLNGTAGTAPSIQTATITSGDTTTTETYTNTKLIVNLGTNGTFNFGNTSTDANDSNLTVQRSTYLEVWGSGTVNINTTNTLRVGRVAYDEDASETVVMNNSSDVMFTAAVYGKASLIYTGSGDVTVANRALANSTYSGVLTLSGTGEFHLGNVTDDGQEDYTLTNGSRTGVGSHVIINEGNTLYIHVWEDNQDSANGGYTHSQTATDLVSFITPVTLNGGTLYSQDGAYYFTKAVTVNNGTATDGSAVTSTIRQNWGKTLVFEKITGAGDLIWDNTNSDPTTDTKYNAWSVVKSTDGFTGAVTFSRSGNGRRLVIPSTGCFENTKVSFSDTGDLTKLVLEGDRTIGMIDGSGVTVVSGTTGTDGAVTESTGHVLTVAGISATTTTDSTTEEATVASTDATTSGTFSGTIDNTVPLTLGANAPDLTIAGTLGDNTYTQAVTLNSGTLTLAPSAATTLSGTVTTSAGSTLVVGGELANTLSGAITNAGTVELGGTGATTVSGAIANTGTVSISGSGDNTISGSISGTGTLTSSGTGTLTGANTYTGGTSVTAGTLTIASTNVDYGTDAYKALPDDHTVNVASGATLSLSAGHAYINVTGDGTLSVPSSGAFMLGGLWTSADAANTITIKDMDIEGTLNIRNWNQGSFTKMFTPTGTVTVNGTIQRDQSNTGSTAVTLTIPSGGTLTGTGTISIDTVLDDGSTFRVSDPSAANVDGGNLSVASLSYGTNESVTFAFDTAISEDGALYTHMLRMATETDEAPIPSSPTVTEAGTKVYNVKIVADEKPNLSAYKCVIPSMASYSNESVQKITNVGYGKTLSSVTGKTLTGSDTPKTLAIDDFNSAFALFDNVVKVETDTAGAHNAIITYDFGISGVTLVTESDTQYAILTVEVSNSSTNNTASFSSGTSVAVYQGGTQITDVTEVDSEGKTLTTTSSGASVRYFKVPLNATTGTTELTVRAVSSTTASN